MRALVRGTLSTVAWGLLIAAYLCVVSVVLWLLAWPLEWAAQPIEGLLSIALSRSFAATGTVLVQIAAMIYLGFYVPAVAIQKWIIDPYEDRQYKKRWGDRKLEEVPISEEGQ